LWSLEVPLCITHLTETSSRPPFVVSVPRFSYLALLLPRLTAYFGSPCSSFHHEEVQLRNLPVGLLVDLYQPPVLPWRLVVGDGPEWDIGDTFLNGAKEADFVRNNNAQQIMSLSKADTTALWNAVQDSKPISVFYFGLQADWPCTPMSFHPLYPFGSRPRSGPA
jgi:autophagy-related protein 5